MTVAITIHLFQAVYTGHGYFGRFWEIANYISVMVNGHYIHFYKNNYNKLTPILLIHLFWPPHASVSEWCSYQPRKELLKECSLQKFPVEWNKLLSYLLLIKYIVISKSKNATFCIPVLFIEPLHLSLSPPPTTPILSRPCS